LRAAGFDKATGLATSDATFANNARDRELQTASLLGNLGQAEGADNRANIGLLGDMGATQRGITQDQIAAPTELLKLISALNSGQNYGLFSGQQSTGTSNGTTNGTTTNNGTSSTVESGGQLASLLAGLGAAGQGLGAMGVSFSDARLKADIQKIGTDDAGRNIYSFRYTADAERKRRTGHMAQELLISDPEAVCMVAGGYLAIDYGKLAVAG
jgi:hypothetical protein